MRLTKQKLPRYLNNVKFLKPSTKHKDIIQIIGKQKNISKDKSRPVEYLLELNQNEIINVWNKKYKDKSVQWYVAGKDDVINKYFGNLLFKIREDSLPGFSKRKNPQEEKSLYICRGSVHVPKYTYTLDSNEQTKPSIIADITEPLHLTKYNKYFDKVILENCPFYIYSIPYVNSKSVTDLNYLLNKYKEKKALIYFKPNFQTFFNIYNLLKTNGLLYISNWGLIEMYTTEKDSKKVANNFVNDLEGMFKFNDIIKSPDQNLLKTILVLKK